MKPLVLLLLLLSFHVKAQEKDYGYYVKITGDTVKLGKKDYVYIDSHPQLLKVKDANGKWKVVLPDSVVFMRKYVYTYRKPRFVDYELVDIPMDNGRSCRHYLNKLYTGSKAEIHETPYCDRCKELHYYIVSEGKYVATMKRANFQEIIVKHFSDNATLMGFAAKKKYWMKVYKYLYNLQTPAKT